MVALETRAQGALTMQHVLEPVVHFHLVYKSLHAAFAVVHREVCIAAQIAGNHVGRRVAHIGLHEAYVVARIVGRGHHEIYGAARIDDKGRHGGLTDRKVSHCDGKGLREVYIAALVDGMGHLDDPIHSDGHHDVRIDGFGHLAVGMDRVSGHFAHMHHVASHVLDNLHGVVADKGRLDVRRAHRVAVALGCTTPGRQVAHHLYLERVQIPQSVEWWRSTVEVFQNRDAYFGNPDHRLLKRGMSQKVRLYKLSFFPVRIRCREA